MAKSTADELGAHVSAAGGIANAPGRARELGSVVLQMFTKQPSRWADPVFDDETAAAFRAQRRAHGITTVAVHDSYLINLASADATLHARSLEAFGNELQRCERIGADFVVSHPGNATDGDRAASIARNADAVTAALRAVPGSVRLLLETTAGTGSALGANFEELAAIIERIPPDVRPRVGVCLDSCHVWAAGYDIRTDLGGVLDHFDDVVGLDRLRLLHLNDSVRERGSRRDRHAGIGEGTLGDVAFRAIMNEPRLRALPKLLETPKGDDPVAADRANLARLRALRAHKGTESRTL